MKAQGNGTPETCAANLLNIVRGEIPYDRMRGRDGSLEFLPNSTDDAIADAEWVLATYEPRVDVDGIESVIENARTGDYSLLAKVKRKEAEE